MDDTTTTTTEAAPLERGMVAGNFQLNAQLPNGKTLSFAGYILQGELTDKINEKLDVAMKVVERQRLIAEIPVLEEKLKMLEQAKSQIETILAETHARIEGKSRVLPKDEQALKANMINLKKITSDIEDGHRAIAAARELAAAA